MVLVYLIVGLLNIFSQHNNYGIKMEDPNIDIRVRRNIQDTVKPEFYNIPNNSDIFLKRAKRYAYYKKTKITYNDLLKYSTNNSQSVNLKNRYDIFNPNYDFLNATRNNQNNNITGANNGYTVNSRPIVRSYPYGYPPGYEPRANGYSVETTTRGYRNQNAKTPVFFNYQNANGPDFAGYRGYTANISGTPGYNTATVQYEGSYSPRPKNYPWNSALAPYPPTKTQNRINNNFPTNYNNYNNIPAPFNKQNLSQYAINFNNGTFATNNTYMPYIPVNYNVVTSRNDYTFPDISDYVLPSNNTNIYPKNNNTNIYHNNNNTNFYPNNNNIYPSNNTNATPSNVNSTVTTTPRTLSGCVICNIPCPRFMRKFGRFCMPEEDDEYR